MAYTNKEYRNCIGLYDGQVVGLRQDGTVVVAGIRNPDVIRKVSLWRNIVAVSIGDNIITGVETSGSVRNVTWYYDEKKDTYSTFDGYTFACRGDIKVKSVCSPASWRVFGLQTDGTVRASKSSNSTDDYDEAVVQPISKWCDIIAIFSNSDTLVAIKTDGSVVKITWKTVTPSSGWGYVYRSTIKNVVNTEGEIIKDIVSVFPHKKRKQAAYIKSDGSIIAEDDCLSGLTNVISITACTWGDEYGSGHIRNYFALQSDGTVVTTEQEDIKDKIDVSGLRDIVAISAHRNHFIGLKSDGSVVSLGTKDAKKIAVTDWKNIGPALESEVTARERKDSEQSAKWVSQGKCPVDGGDFGGLFTKKCKICGKYK